MANAFCRMGMEVRQGQLLPVPFGLFSYLGFCQVPEIVGYTVAYL